MRRLFIQISIFIALVVTTLTSCGVLPTPDFSGGVSIQTSYPFDTALNGYVIASAGDSLTIEVKSNSEWSMSSEAEWIKVGSYKGTGNESVKITIAENNNDSRRNSRILIMDGVGTNYINIFQESSSRYMVPVIFHVIYQKSYDPLQYVAANKIETIIENVNKYYRGEYNQNSVDMNITFTLATHSPDGAQLKYPGVEYIKWQESYPIDYSKFMSETKGKAYLWDPNKYINVMLYNFDADPNSTSYVLGSSHMPYTVKGENYLEGTYAASSENITLDNLGYTHCSSINSLFINERSTTTKHNNNDIDITVSHELGHYLGLYHPFAQDATTGEYLQNDSDTDYCLDTPSYNRYDYEQWFSRNNDGTKTFDQLAARENSTTSFTAYNIMDYYVNYANIFTPNQAERVHHVLKYSPLIPGEQLDKDVVSGKSSIILPPTRPSH